MYFTSGLFFCNLYNLYILLLLTPSRKTHSMDIVTTCMRSRDNKTVFTRFKHEKKNRSAMCMCGLPLDKRSTLVNK